MKLPEFMQPFNGEAPTLTQDERARATEYFRKTVTDTLFRFPERVEYMGRATLDDRVPTLTLYPAEMPLPVENARVSIIYNNRGANFYTHIGIPQQEGHTAGVVYCSLLEESVHRYDTPDLEALDYQRREVRRQGIQREYLKEREIIKAHERELGINGCDIGFAEMVSLRGLLALMRPQGNTL